MLKFGTAGIPLSTQKASLVNGIKQIKNLGLDCMEIEWVYGVRINPNNTAIVKQTAIDNNIALTAHGPYWINLNSNDEEKIEKSVERIVKTAKIGILCGVESITFHAGFYLKQDPKMVFEQINSKFLEIVTILKKDSIDLQVCPETTGKPTQFGSIEELVRLSEIYANVFPCIDWAHLYARSLGKVNNYEEFASVLRIIINKLGKQALKHLHMHVAGMNYGPKGERNHLVLEDSEFNYVDLIKALKDFGVEGYLICESPNLEKDALLLKKLYYK